MKASGALCARRSLGFGLGAGGWGKKARNPCALTIRYPLSASLLLPLLSYPL